MRSMTKLILCSGVAAFALAAPARAEWKPVKPIEFIATAGPGGGTDIISRTVQGIITKYKFIDQPIVVVNKGGGSGAEGYTYGKAMAGDPYKVVFGTSNAWQQPMVSKVAFNYTDLTPIAAMAHDEFLLWVKQDSPWKTAGDYLKAAKSGNLKMGGAQSKDTDEVLTRMIEKIATVKITYIPFKSGGEAGVQLAGGHIDSHVNNPSESVGQWRGGTPVRIDPYERAGHARAGSRNHDRLRAQRRARRASHDLAATRLEPGNGDRQCLDRKPGADESGGEPFPARRIAGTARLFVAKADIGREVGGDRAAGDVGVGRQGACDRGGGGPRKESASRRSHHAVSSARPS